MTDTLALPESGISHEVHLPPKFDRVQVANRFYTVDDLGQKHFEPSWGYGSSQEGARLDLRTLLEPRTEVYVATEGVDGQEDIIYHLVYDTDLSAWVDDTIFSPRKDRFVLTSGHDLEIGQVSGIRVQAIDRYGVSLRDDMPLFSRGRVTEIVYIDKPEFVSEGEEGPTTDIIGRYQTQRDRFVPRAESMTEAQRTKIVDISRLHDDYELRLAYEKLPGGVVVPHDVVEEVRHMAALTEHTIEVLKERGYPEDQLAATKERYHTLETGGIIAESRFSGSVYVPLNDVLVGERSAHTETIYVSRLAQDRAEQGYKVVGTIHTHPYIPHYILNQYQPLPDMTYPERESDAEVMLGYVCRELWRRISPPSTADLSSSTELRIGDLPQGDSKVHLVASKSKIYAIVPSAEAIVLPREEHTEWTRTFRDINMRDKAISYLASIIPQQMLEIIQAKYEAQSIALYNEYLATKDRDEQQHLMNQLVQSLIDELPEDIVSTLEQQLLRGVIGDCEEAYIGLYVGDWDPLAPATDLQLQRIA